MRVCPNCRYKNDDTDDICLNCDRMLPLTAQHLEARSQAPRSAERSQPKEALSPPPRSDHALPPPPEAPGRDALPQPSSPAPAPNAGLRRASRTLGCLSSVVWVLSLLFAVLFTAYIHTLSERDGAGILAGSVVLPLWLLGALLAVLSLICGVVYDWRARNTQGAAGCQSSIGCGALALGLLVILIGSVLPF